MLVIYICADVNGTPPIFNLQFLIRLCVSGDDDVLCVLSWTIRSGLQQTAATLKDLTPTSGIGRPCALSADWGGGSGSGVGGREEGKEEEEEEGQEEQLTSRVLNFCLISPFCWYTHPVFLSTVFTH